MDFINEKLKTTYTSIFKELQPLDFESTRDMIYDICSKKYTYMIKKMIYIKSKTS